MNRIDVDVFTGRCAAIVLGVLAMLVVGGHSAEASHFYGGTTSWERDPTSIAQQTITFTVDAEWRSSFTAYTGGPNPPVGRELFGLHVLNLFGSGFATTLNMNGVVTDVMPLEDRFVTHSVVTFDAPSSAFPIAVEMSGCCRISSLREGNNDQSYRLYTVIDPARAVRSPKYTGPLRVFLPTAQASSFPVPGSAFSGAVFRAAITAPSLSYLVSPRPIGIDACAAGCPSCAGTDAGQCANGLSISPANVVSWTPQVAGKYGVQLTLTSYDAGANPLVSVPVDMLIDVRGPCSTCAVVSAPATASATVGASLSLPVTVTDPNGANVQLAGSGMPATATLAPTDGLAPLNATLQWTPVAGDVGPHTVCFQATNFSGVPLAPTCTVITVTSAAPAPCAAGSYSATGTAPCTPCAAGTFTTAAGQIACTPCTTCDGGAYPASACTATQDTACATCDASCTTCDGPSATDCTSCPTAEPPVAGVCLPAICAPGSYSATGSAPCSPCPAGFFGNAAGQTSCMPCAPGTFAAGAGQLVCAACAAGTFAASAGRTACDPCTIGCDAGEYEASACAATQDTVCGTCDASCATCGGPTPADCTSCPAATPPVGGMCLPPGCSPAPAAGCRPPEVGGKSKLDLKDSADDAKDSLKWKWSKGTAALADFGDPTTTDDWYLCIYDDGTRVSATALPAGDTCAGNPCWAAKSTGFVYKDKDLTPGGAQSATMKAGAAEKASISLTAKGAPLEMPAPGTLTGPVRVQLQRGDRSVCFESTFSAPFKKNLGGTFSDVDDATVATTSTTISVAPTTSTTVVPASAAP